jgi:hypothetical protein
MLCQQQGARVHSVDNREDDVPALSTRSAQGFQGIQRPGNRSEPSNSSKESASTDLLVS